MAPINSIWSQMGYTPPRGQCNHKEGLLSPKCPCQRFMIHPLKVSTSFECDGCGHHASFHDMENQKDDAIVKRWQAAEDERQGQNGDARSRKRPRKAIEGVISGSSNEKMIGSATTGASSNQVDATSKVSLRSRAQRPLAQEANWLSTSTRIIELSDSGEPGDE